MMGAQLAAYRTQAATPKAIAIETRSMDERARTVRSLGAALGAHVVDMLDDATHPTAFFDLHYEDPEQAFDVAGQLFDDVRENRLSMQVYEYGHPDEPMRRLWWVEVRLNGQVSR